MRVRIIEPTKPLAPMRKKVCAYARVSSASAQGESLENQTTYYQALIQANPGYDYAGVFADYGLTGTKDNRPEFQKMLILARDNKLDIILTKSISRFARNTTIVLKVVRELKSLGVEIIFEKENISTFDGDGELMLTVLSSFAQEESKSISENLKWRYRRKFANSELAINATRFLGYDKDEYGDLVINNSQAEIVTRIYSDYVSGKGSFVIAKELNAEGVLTIAGGRWHSSTILTGAGRRDRWSNPRDHRGWRRMNKKMDVQGIAIAIRKKSKAEYISLTDIAKYKSDEPNDVLRNWLRSKDTIEFLGLWEKINNSDFKPVEFEGFKNQAGSNTFTMSPSKWIEKTNAIGIMSNSGRYGGTFAHQDIAFEFASWVSAEFRLYLIKEFQRLVEAENRRLNIEWTVSRTLAKINYKIHTDSIKQNLIPETLTKQQQSLTYANEADLLNMALFSQTARDWRENNADKEGNIRDYAMLEQLLVLANMESLNAEYIKAGMSQQDRLINLNRMAIEQMKVLTQSSAVAELRKLGSGDK